VPVTAPPARTNLEPCTPALSLKHKEAARRGARIEDMDRRHSKGDLSESSG
jgi:hypothetical protein